MSDDFNRPALNGLLWAVEDPVGGGTFETMGAYSGDAHLKIIVPGGRNHDAWMQNDALRVMQAVDDRDFEVVAKFDTLPALTFQFEGILVEDAAGVGLRFNLLRDAQSRLQAYVGKGIGSTAAAQIVRNPIGDIPLPGSGNAGRGQVRVKRQAQTWTFWTSPDGASWTQQAFFTNAVAVARVGLLAGNFQADGKPPVFPVEADYLFNAGMPIVPEDGVPLEIALGNNQAVLSWPSAAAGFVLETTANLSSSGWLAVTNPVVVVGDESTVMREVNGSESYFRLNKRIAGWRYRLPIQVSANGVERLDKPAEVVLNLTTLLQERQQTAQVNPLTFRVIEVDAEGGVLNGAVPFRFDPAAGYHAETHAAGTLVLLLPGVTGAAATRRFYLSFDSGTGIPPAVVSNQVSIVHNPPIPYQGQSSYQITTPSASYYYHIYGAGFAALYDQSGNDWISYRPSGGSAGNYRGIPNLVYPEGHFHPGNSSCASSVVSVGPLKVKVYSESLDTQ